MKFRRNNRFKIQTLPIDKPAIIEKNGPQRGRESNKSKKQIPTYHGNACLECLQKYDNKILLIF